MSMSEFGDGVWSVRTEVQVQAEQRPSLAVAAMWFAAAVGLMMVVGLLLCDDANAATVTDPVPRGQALVVPVSRDLRARPSGGGVQLQISPTVASPETQVRFRLQNRTDVIIKFGAFFEVQAYSSSGWLSAAFSPPGPWPAYSAQILGGQTGGWQEFAVPAGSPPGLYRVRKPIIVAGARRRSVSAPFEVGRPYAP